MNARGAGENRGDSRMLMRKTCPVTTPHGREKQRLPGMLGRRTNTHTKTFQRQHMAHHICIAGPHGARVERTTPNGTAVAAGNQLAPLAHRRPWVWTQCMNSSGVLNLFEWLELYFCQDPRAWLCSHIPEQFSFLDSGYKRDYGNEGSLHNSFNRELM